MLKIILLRLSVRNSIPNTKNLLCFYSMLLEESQKMNKLPTWPSSLPQRLTSMLSSQRLDPPHIKIMACTLPWPRAALFHQASNLELTLHHLLFSFLEVDIRDTNIQPKHAGPLQPRRRVLWWPITPKIPLTPKVHLDHDLIGSWSVWLLEDSCKNDEGVMGGEGGIVHAYGGWVSMSSWLVSWQRPW